MTALKKASLLSHHPNSSSTTYKSLYLNPLTAVGPNSFDKENVVPNVGPNSCSEGRGFVSPSGKEKSLQTFGAKAIHNKIAMKPSSLQLCMKLNEPDSRLGGTRTWEPLSSSSDVWEFSDSESAPASSWSTLPNRSLLCRPLPLDVGRCTCIIVKEPAQGGALYSLYTNQPQIPWMHLGSMTYWKKENFLPEGTMFSVEPKRCIPDYTASISATPHFMEGQGRQDRKLAVAQHGRRGGRSQFIVAQKPKGIFCSSDDSFLGTITANLMGSKYQIWDQGSPLDSLKNQSRRLLGVVAFVPTITTLTGSFRSMRAWIPKHQSMQLKNTKITQIQHINGLPKDWEEKRNRAHQLFSRVPFYNNVTRRYELDFREKAGRTGPRIQASVKNFQLIMEEQGRQTILQLGRIGKSKFLMDYRYPLTGYQAFCICLASIDSKLCCSV